MECCQCQHERQKYLKQICGQSTGVGDTSRATPPLHPLPGFAAPISTVDPWVGQGNASDAVEGLVCPASIF